VIETEKALNTSSTLCEQMLWDRIPETWKRGSTFYTDFWESYENVVPKEQHQSVGKETGQTSLIERLNNTLRQRIGRLVRKSLSFSKKLENHIGMIFNFLHHYNESLLD
jgi:insertion element IS1 protein InsB